LSFTLLAFSTLSAALAAVWLRSRLWIPACAAACALALLAGVVDVYGLAALAVFALLCVWARSATRGPRAWLAHAFMLVAIALLFLHAVPGFDNPRVVDAAVLGPGAVPYTKYLNFDKGIAGLFLIGIYVPRLTAAASTPSWPARDGEAVAVFGVVTVLVMLLALGLGYVGWDPKLPDWAPLWLWSMVFLTALPEEALFRGTVQNAFESWMGTRRHATAVAVIAAGVLFGLAHAAGGPLYVLLASVAGIGYGWIYASTRSLAWAIAAHAGLNTVHFLLFSYPALNR
jgi:uncharacterized protein